MTSMKKKQHYCYDKDKNTIATSLWGKALLTSAQLNKGTAFTHEEREAFGLLGKLPSRVETLDEQVQRAYKQLTSFKIEIKKIYFSMSYMTTIKFYFIDSLRIILQKYYH